MAFRETRVTVPAPPAEVFEFLSSAANVPLFAPGIEEAHLLGGQDHLQGAWLGLRTRRGRELRAQITHYHEGEGWTVVDERSTVSQIQVEPARGGTLVTATLSGQWRPEAERRVFAEWERKLADLPAQLAPPIIHRTIRQNA
jgi:Polyketide cyclase / dehydrase and lipid transport